MRPFALVAVACLAFGCIKPEARGLKHSDPPVLAAGWSQWDRPEFTLAAPDSWSPYLSRAPMAPRPADPYGETPMQAGTQWTIHDKAGDENRIAELAKQGMPLRLYDGQSRDASGAIHTFLSVKVDSSQESIPDEVANFRASLAANLAGEEEVSLPIGTAYAFHTKSNGNPTTIFLLINQDQRFLIEFVQTDPAVARQILETLRVKR